MQESAWHDDFQAPPEFSFRSQWKKPHEGSEESVTPLSQEAAVGARSFKRQTSTSHHQTLGEQELEAVLNFVTAKSKQENRIERPDSTQRVQEQSIDLIAGGLILLNAVLMGILMDKPDVDEGPWLVVKLGFAIVFWIEIILKNYLFGWRHMYCGENAGMNMFDSCLIVTDSVDILISFFKTAVPFGNSILLLRTIRLLRVVRLFRIFNAPVFDDLLAMVHALKSGSATLLWSVVFFFFFIYVTALIFRTSFGPHPDDADYEEVVGKIDPAMIGFYFQNVPRSMLTTYRCSFGDCSTQLGTPILEATEQELGSVASVLLSGLIFISTVGLFNIISAVFLERIMVYAESKELDKQRDRLQDKRLWHDKLSRFIDIQLQLHEQVRYNACGEIDPDSLKLDPKTRNQVGYQWLAKMSNDSLASKCFSRDLMEISVQTDKETRQLLLDLDIEPSDCVGLSGTLDRNNNGQIDAVELISGLGRLRGRARRGDIVAVDLTLQSMQARLDEIWLHHKRVQSHFDTVMPATQEGNSISATQERSTMPATQVSAFWRHGDRNRRDKQRLSKVDAV